MRAGCGGLSVWFGLVLLMVLWPATLPNSVRLSDTGSQPWSGSHTGRAFFFPAGRSGRPSIPIPSDQAGLPSHALVCKIGGFVLQNVALTELQMLPGKATLKEMGEAK